MCYKIIIAIIVHLKSNNDGAEKKSLSKIIKYLVFTISLEVCEIIIERTCTNILARTKSFDSSIIFYGESYSIYVDNVNTFVRYDIYA